MTGVTDTNIRHRTETPWERFNYIGQEDGLRFIRGPKQGAPLPLMCKEPEKQLVASCASDIDAAHIVHCVNGHDELVKALGDCLDMLDLLLHTEEVKFKNTAYLAKAAERYEHNVFIEKKWKKP